MLGSFNLLQSADVKKASSLYSISDAEMGARAKELGITSHELYYARTHYRKNHKTLEEFRAADKEAIEEAARQYWKAFPVGPATTPKQDPVSVARRNDVIVRKRAKYNAKKKAAKALLQLSTATTT